MKTITHNKLKAIIYKRVSSGEQVKGTSLETQEEFCRKYCDEKDFEVVAVFTEEGASAKSTDRAEFLRAIEYCRKNKGNVDVFVVAKVDRFARNTEDHFRVRKQLLEYGVTLHSVSEPIGQDPVGKLLETILAGTSDFDNAIRKQRCSDGMSARIDGGIYPWHPPIGYDCQNAKKQGLKKTLPDEPHKVFFPIIQQALKEMRAGLHNKASLVRRLDELGLAKHRGSKTYSQFVDTLLEEHRLKFYAGWIWHPWKEEYKKGLHKPMIDDEDVYKILAILSGKRRSEKHNRHNPMFPLRGWALCSVCGGKLTASPSVGEHGGVYPYYHCFNKQCSMRGKGLAKRDLEGAFTEYLNKVTPKEDWLEMFQRTVVAKWKDEGVSFEKEAQNQERKLKMLEEKLKRIYDMREDGSYGKEEFQERRDEAKNDIMATKISLSEARIEQFDIEGAVIYATNFIKDLGRQWADLPHRLQPKFQKLVFPEGFSYDKKSGVRTPKLGYIYEVNRVTTTQNTTLVDPRGFEPPTSGVQNRRSSQMSYGPIN